jgi:hypothetical protein
MALTEYLFYNCSMMVWELQGQLAPRLASAGTVTVWFLMIWLRGKADSTAVIQRQVIQAANGAGSRRFALTTSYSKRLMLLNGLAGRVPWRGRVAYYTGLRRQTA